MRFVLLVEGYTERKAVGDFLRRWLDVRLSARVGVQTVKFEGCSHFHDDAAKKARMHITGPGNEKILGVAGLLDLYGPPFYPTGVTTSADRKTWGKKHFEERFNDPRFRMFFAVHEVEAWLLSQPEIFPPEIRKAFPGKISEPERVNFNEPPAKLLERLYVEKLKRKYMKVTDGTALFAKLNPETAYHRCPGLKELLDWMLEQAKARGL